MIGHGDAVADLAVVGPEFALDDEIAAGEIVQAHVEVPVVAEPRGETVRDLAGYECVGLVQSVAARSIRCGRNGRVVYVPAGWELTKAPESICECPDLWYRRNDGRCGRLCERAVDIKARREEP